MFTGSEDRRLRSISLGKNCALPGTRHPERKSRDPVEVTLKISRARAFTLLEIMLAVIILGMMSLTIYRFVQANVTAMRVSSEADAVEARYDGLRELLTQQLQSLPPGTAALAGEPLKIDGHDRDELTWFCPAGPGLLTRYATGDFRVSLRLRARDAKSRQLDLGLLRKPKEDTAVGNEHETWVRLIDNVGTLQIRFFDSRLNTWVQRWTDTVTLPRLVKVVIGRTDAKAPTEITVPLARMPLLRPRNRVVLLFCFRSGRFFCWQPWSCRGP
jgi:prepilin-type N-terminal cleavage/methylation domain-containing protein